MLDEFGSEIEHAETRMDATMRKMAKVLHLSGGGNQPFNKQKNLSILFISDRRQWMAIGALSSAMVVVIFLIILV